MMNAVSHESRQPVFRKLDTLSQFLVPMIPNTLSGLCSRSIRPHTAGSSVGRCGTTGVTVGPV
jgi:hypothetical protein